ncbi:MAG: glycosyltransferase family 2 protein [Nitrospirae bacterium]|nr:MAG: glycosyltransferase family 2 protein [Nitrospirota bacterium]
MERCLIIIPAHNEEDALSRVLKDLEENVPRYQKVVVNDGSTDNTSAVARANGVVVIDLPYNLGIGGAVQTGYRYAFINNYDIAVQFDADGQHIAKEIPLLVNPVLHGEADLVVGSRFLKESGYTSSVMRQVGIKILAGVISLITRSKITDPTSGFRAANRKVIEFFNRVYPDDYPEPESLVLLHKAGFKVREVPVRMRKRQAGDSTITPMRAIYYMIKVLLSIFVDVLKKIEKPKGA